MQHVDIRHGCSLDTVHKHSRGQEVHRCNRLTSNQRLTLLDVEDRETMPGLVLFVAALSM